jgi:murein DD-endopeptidase MepM/ murein hydrolase activator NlpD
MDEERSTPAEEDEGTSRRVLSLGILIPILIVAGLIPLAFAGWKDLYVRFLERTPPQLSFTLPRGIGIVPVRVTVDVKDTESGLEEITIAYRQGRAVKELLPSTDLEGRLTDQFTVDFKGKEGNLEPGKLALAVTASDRSIWANSKTTVVDLVVDFNAPALTVVAAPQILWSGSAALLFYRVAEEDVSESGVQIGRTVFQGYPARGWDIELEQEDLYAVWFAVPLDTPPGTPIRLFADDRVGNSASIQLPIVWQPRTPHAVAHPLRESLLREGVATLVNQNVGKIQEFLTNSGLPPPFAPDDTATGRLISAFHLLHGPLREINRNELLRLVSSTPSRPSSYLTSVLSRQAGRIESSYGDVSVYTLDDSELGRAVETGFMIVPPRGDRHVFALAEGIVVFSDNLGVYGRCVGIDHGLGITTIYGHLDTVSARQGALVKAGDVLGEAGRSWSNDQTHFYFEMRIGGVPVDAREWWDSAWYGAHVQKRINDARRSMGLRGGL